MNNDKKIKRLLESMNALQKEYLELKNRNDSTLVKTVDAYGNNFKNQLIKLCNSKRTQQDETVKEQVVSVYKKCKFENVDNLLKILNEDADRVLSSKEIENRFNISNFTARSDLNNLETLGFLEKIQVNKIKHNFIKSKSFNKILKTYNL